jgi:proteasome lid subunit RPN8/RPN11
MTHAESQTTALRDVSQIDTADLPHRAIPAVTGGSREPRFQIAVKQSALNKLHRHGLSQDVEVCGVLVGDVYRDDSGPWLYVEDAIEGDHAAQRDAQVTFTAETWAHIQSVMDADHPDKKILGWYHTHPGFGIFLSEMDQFIQENFFPLPWQVALVYDPKAGEEGVFVWKDGKPEAELFLIESDVPREHDTLRILKPKDVSSAATAGATSADFATLAQRLDAIERRQRIILTLLAIIGLIALAWPLVVSAFLPNLLNPKEPPPPIRLPADDSPARSPR